MRWKVKRPSYEKEIERLKKPARWFAWRPVKTQEGNWVWLERVYRILTRWEDFTIFTGGERYLFIIPVILFKYYYNNNGKLSTISFKEYVYHEALTEFEYQVKEASRKC